MVSRTSGQPLHPCVGIQLQRDKLARGMAHGAPHDQGITRWGADNPYLDMRHLHAAVPPGVLLGLRCGVARIVRTVHNRSRRAEKSECRCVTDGCPYCRLVSLITRRLCALSHSAAWKQPIKNIQQRDALCISKIRERCPEATGTFYVFGSFRR